MLDQVVINALTPMTLNITAVEPDEILVVTSISGLTSGGVTQYMGELAREGGYYQGRRAKNLTPVINLKMNPDYANNVSVSAIREKLYRTFYNPNPGVDGVVVTLKDDELTDRVFVGYTENINTDQWVKEQTAQVSMTCVEAYLKSATPTGLTDPVGWNTLAIDYDGSAPTGWEMTLEIKTNTNRVVVDLNGHKLTLDSPASYLAGQQIYINTIQGSRKIILDGVDIMAHLAPNSEWLKLDRPVNTIKVSGPVDGDAKASLISYRFQSLWWGI